MVKLAPKKEGGEAESRVRLNREVMAFMVGNREWQSVTLDSNLVADYWERRPGWEDVQALLELGAQGVLDLAVTAVIERDFPDDPWASRLLELPTLGVLMVGAPATLGSWVLGRDVLGDAAFDAAWAEFAAVAASRITKRQRGRPPSSEDWTHLHAHWLLGRTVFLTRDKPLLSLAPKLLERFGIVVLAPSNFLAGLPGSIY